jgi:hypothetical protein
MSEERCPCNTILLKNQGKKSIKIELFPASLWRSNWRPGKRNIHPTPKARDAKEWFAERYRIRLGGKWFQAERVTKKYSFFTIDECLQVLKLQTVGDL